ncbi:hypothetical protein SAMN05443999_10260 [Roseovarius azorensis]|uniref:TVP38/TMEM64 family membrane protein n=1 Tax=Roseovarius azorensis TaxID=1287727 RepID=A0A1H7J0L4_9RHOB|nr:hypothetical protein [Roseovarius azorensis]SEK68176.1 hypothetical protein SAMN05443999_10260 [Roseovarius azorensis]
MDERTPRHATLTPPPVRVGLLRTLLRLGAAVVLVIALHHLFIRAEAWIAQSAYSWAMPGLMLAVLVIYALLIAIPFVPGVEIGLGVLAVSGPEMAPLVWLATASGLTLAYMVGCKVPYRWLHRFLLDMHLTGACRLLERFEGMRPEERAALMQSLLPARYFGWVIRYRYVNMAVLINIPGNSLIGGGGGIALLSGLSGMFRPAWTMLTIAVATAPVPLAIWLFGWEIPWG